MGIAAFIGGLIISRDAQNLVQNYWVAALVGACASVAAIFLVGKLEVVSNQHCHLQISRCTDLHQIIEKFAEKLVLATCKC